MKFAKELDRDLVPEWRAKYLDYKQGKKKVKAVARAVARVNATPRTPARPEIGPQRASTYGTISSPFYSRSQPASTPWRFNEPASEPVEPLRPSPAPLGKDSPPGRGEGPTVTKKTPPMAIPKEQTPSEAHDTAAMGSFVLTPPSNAKIPFELPDPALPPQMPPTNISNPNPNDSLESQHGASVDRPETAYEAEPTTAPQIRPVSTPVPLRNRASSSQRGPLLRRMFSSIASPPADTESRRNDLLTVAVDQVKSRQKEFFSWMDNELEKVETFYKLKEDEAGARLIVLRDQLHEMRNRRTQEVAEALKIKATRGENNHTQQVLQSTQTDTSNRSTSRDRLNSWLDPIERALGEARAAVMKPRIGSNSKALHNLARSPALQSKPPPVVDNTLESRRDYIRRPQNEHEVSYRVAKRKLKLALQEYYRGMELLKSYALLNRTAFRKINKKYDKAINAHPPLRYMSEKVNKAWFVQSDVLDGHLHTVEDLYARYFERGNHKVATGKLRRSQGKRMDLSASSFRSGILIGTGAVFTIQGVISGANLLHHPDPIISTQASYLLQIYGGYFLALYLFSWFCFDCSIWERNRINYTFVFEFDLRNNLDWRQLAEFPAFLIFLMGLFVWLNFSQYGASDMFIYYPVILIFLTVLIIFFPAQVLFHKSRKWFVYSHWRLLLAGLYPVEFRDFLLGDMYCSLTYTVANIGLFFCLYAHHWNDPPQCNSSHSRLLGFLTALPGIWRALQCLRRYRDTGNVFPHLVNCGKYSMTIIYYATLSAYRIQKTSRMLALFATFAAINAIYCSIWDLLMDWSLLQSNANKRFLRDVRGYKNPNWYYLAMVLDPILRFNWIFYAIYTQDVQHSTFVSFLVGLSEVSRRGMWTLFRVENEHCANVAHFKASRDVPLPYELISSSQESLARRQGVPGPVGAEAVAPSGPPSISHYRTRPSTALEAHPSPTASSIRRRAQPVRTFTNILANAHMQDFEKKRRVTGVDSDSPQSQDRGDGLHGEERAGSSDEDDEEDFEHDVRDLLEVQNLVRERDLEQG